MECGEARQKSLEYLDGQLDLEGKTHLEAHLFTCAACLDEVRTLEALRSDIAALPIPDPSPGFARRLHARLEDERRRRPTRFGAYRVSPAAAAAILAVLLGAGAALWGARSAFVKPSGGIAAPAVVHDGAVASTLDRLPGEPVEAMRQLWPRGDEEWNVLKEAKDRQLLSLALGSESEDEVDLEAVVRVWAAIAPHRRPLSELAGLGELTDQELTLLLAKLVTG